MNYAAVQSPAKPGIWLLPRNVNGRYEGLMLREGLYLAITQRSALDGELYRDVVGDHFKVHFRLAGRSYIHGEDRVATLVGEGTTSYLVQPANSLKFERGDASSEERSVTLACSREFVSEYVTNDLRDFPSSIQDYVHGRVSCFFCASAPLLPQSQGLVQQILLYDTSDPMSRLMIESRVLELLHLTLQQICNLAAPNLIIRQRDRRKVDELCEMLQVETASSLTLFQLSRALAWNETQMMECFKEITGTTIANYRHRLRMERAMRQLRETEDSIIDVALYAGYEHASNFSTAFRRTFGFPPTSVRKGRRRIKTAHTDGARFASNRKRLAVE